MRTSKKDREEYSSGCAWVSLGKSKSDDEKVFGVFKEAILWKAGEDIKKGDWITWNTKTGKIMKWKAKK